MFSKKSGKKLSENEISEWMENNLKKYFDAFLDKKISFPMLDFYFKFYAYEEGTKNIPVQFFGIYWREQIKKIPSDLIIQSLKECPF